MATDAGFLVPPIRVTDNLQLKANEYVVLLKAAEIARFELAPNCELAIHAGAATGGAGALQGAPTREPAFGIPALWIPATAAESARARRSYTVVDGISVLGTHLAEFCCGATRMKAAIPARHQEYSGPCSGGESESHRRSGSEIASGMATVQKVFQNLLRERVSIRDAVTVTEALGEAAAMTKNPVLLTEYARQAIRRLLIKPYLNSSGELPAYLVDATIEHAVEAAEEHGELASRFEGCRHSACATSSIALRARWARWKVPRP